MVKIAEARVMTNINLPGDLHRRFRATVEAEGTTMTAVLRDLVEGYLDGKVQYHKLGRKGGKAKRSEAATTNRQ